MNRKLRIAAFSLLALFLAAEAQARLPTLPAAAFIPPSQAVMVIPDNALTGHGALATPAGLARF